MATKFNNFDGSSTGINIELFLYWNTSVMEELFEENFYRIDDNTLVYMAERDLAVGPDDIQDFPPECKLTSRGYCQGDIRTVYILPEVLWDGGDDPRDFQEDIDHLLWDAPLYCVVKVDDEDFVIHNLLFDVYKYDRDHIVAMFAKAFRPGDPRRGAIIEWLKCNLPRQPDYL